MGMLSIHSKRERKRSKRDEEKRKKKKSKTMRHCHEKDCDSLRASFARKQNQNPSIVMLFKFSFD